MNIQERKMAIHFFWHGCHFITGVLSVCYRFTQLNWMINRVRRQGYFESFWEKWCDRNDNTYQEKNATHEEMAYMQKQD